MINYKIERQTDKFLEKSGGNYSYNYQGKSYEITREFLKDAPKGLQQSFGRFASKQNPPTIQLKPKVVENATAGEKSQAITPEKTNVEVFKSYTDVKKELIRLATTEHVVEEILDMPKVFKALLTEPHTALDHKKKTIDTKVNLTLFVDLSVGYHTSDNMYKPDCSLHAKIIFEAKRIKGINLFTGYGLSDMFYKGKHYSYYTELYRDLPAKMKEKVIVFTQGCGSYGDYNDIKPGSIHFCTGFDHGNNCGCDQIYKAERSKQIMHYKICNIPELSKVML